MTRRTHSYACHMTSVFVDQIYSVTSQLLSASWQNPFGPEVDVCMVGGKMFVLLGGPIEQVTLKCNPDEAMTLCAAHREIIPGYHMNKKHWITVRPGLPAHLLAELIVDSYFLVGKGIAQKRRPALGVACQG